MAVLRISRPGYETALIDIGPASGRVHGSVYGTRGSTVNGALVVGSSERGKANAAQREYKARMREMFPATTPARRAQIAAYKASKACGAMLPALKEPCARAPGHRYDHKSREALDRMAESKTRPIP